MKLKYNKNKLRSYYYYYNILNPILYYKDLEIKYSNTLNLSKLILNFKILKSKNIKFFQNLIDIFYFCKIFSNRLCIKNLLIGDFKNFLRKMEGTHIFCIVQIILRNKKLFIFFNYIYFFFKTIFRKKSFFKNEKFVINFLKKFKKLFPDLRGLLEISIEKKDSKNLLKNKLYFIINFFYLLNDKYNK